MKNNIIKQLGEAKVIETKSKDEQIHLAQHEKLFRVDSHAGGGMGWAITNEMYIVGSGIQDEDVRECAEWCFQESVWDDSCLRDDILIIVDNREGITVVGRVIESSRR